MQKKLSSIFLIILGGIGLSACETKPISPPSKEVEKVGQPVVPPKNVDITGTPRPSPSDQK